MVNETTVVISPKIVPQAKLMIFANYPPLAALAILSNAGEHFCTTQSLHVLSQYLVQLAKLEPHKWSQG